MPRSNYKVDHAGKAYIIGFVMLLIYAYVLLNLPPFFWGIFFEFGLIGGALLFYGLMNRKTTPRHTWEREPELPLGDIPLDSTDTKYLLSEAKSYYKMGLQLDKRIKIDEVQRKQIAHTNNLLTQKPEAGNLYNKRQVAFEHVVNRCNLVLDNDSNHHEAIQLKGEALYHLERYSEALPYQLNALDANVSSYGYFQAATSQYFLKEYTKSLTLLKKALELDPSLTEGWLLLYRIGMKENNYRLALEALNETIYLNPDEPLLKKRQHQLLHSNLKEADLFSLVYPECWKCGSKNGYSFSGKITRVAECLACGAQMRFSLENIRRQLTLAVYKLPDHNAIRLNVDDLDSGEKNTDETK